MPVKPFLYMFHIVLARYDCRMAVSLRKAGAFVTVYPLFEGCSTP